MESLLILLPSVIYWCINEKKGLGLSIAVLLSLWIVFFLEYHNINLPFGYAAGWIIASVIIIIYILADKKIEALLAKGGFRAGMIAAAAVSFLLIIRLPDEKLLIPSGILLGMGAGYCLNFKYVGFKSKILLERTGIAKYLVLLVRILLGSTGFMLILAASGKIIPANSSNVNLYYFICYTLSGLWISAAAPWIFIRLRLAGKALPARPETANKDTSPEKTNDA